jgi:hypothetical protein
MSTRSIFPGSLVLIALFTASVHAQSASATTDRRFLPLIGCWSLDSAGTSGASSGSLTCVAPLAGSADVDAATVIGGRVASHHRIASSAKSRPIDVQGCRGTERTSSSPFAHRIYLHTEYACSAGVDASATTLYSFLPNGDWLEVESVRSGSGFTVRSLRRRDVGIPTNLPRELSSVATVPHLAIAAARAEAAAPIKTEDVIEAMRSTDSTVVRSWILATAQPFTLTGDEFMTMARADVPSSVLQAIMAAPQQSRLGMGVDASGHDVNAYLNTPGGGTAYGAAVAGGVAPTYDGSAAAQCCAQPMYDSYGNYAAPPGYPVYAPAPYGYAPYSYNVYPYALPYISPAYRQFQSFVPRPQQRQPVGVRGGEHGIPPGAARHPTGHRR